MCSLGISCAKPVRHRKPRGNLSDLVILVMSVNTDNSTGSCLIHCHVSARPNAIITFSFLFQFNTGPNNTQAHKTQQTETVWLYCIGFYFIRPMFMLQPETCFVRMKPQASSIRRFTTCSELTYPGLSPNHVLEYPACSQFPVHYLLSEYHCQYLS